MLGGFRCPVGLDARWHEGGLGMHGGLRGVGIHSRMMSWRFTME